MKSFAETFWLAKKEMGRTWLSYPLTALFFLFLGFFAVVSLSGIFELRGFGAEGRRMEDFYNILYSDYLFLMACALLGVNVITGDRTLPRRDASSVRLLFLRRLPIPTESLVRSRAMSMLFALVLNALAFFAPVFFLSDLRELGTSFLWFAGVWVGYALLGAGLCLLLELTASGGVRTLISFGFAASLMAVLVLLEWTVALNLVGRTAQLAQSGYGALPVVFSVLAGVAAFAGLSRLTARRLRERDLSGELSA